MEEFVRKSIQHTMEMRKPMSLIPWQTDRPWKQSFYGWSSGTGRWQGIQSSESSSDKSNVMRLAVYSWNIDFMLPYSEARMNAALRHLEKLTRQYRLNNNIAVIINLQECIPSDLETISGKDWIRDSFYCTDIDTSAWASGAYGTTSLIDRRLQISSCFRVHYSATQMERDALFIDVSVSPGGQKVRLCNTHLESLALEPPMRPAQMRLIATYLHAEGIAGGIVTGDFNATQPFDRSLHSDNDLEDAYLKLGGQEGDGRSDNNGGYTWGQQALPSLRLLYGYSRMDKVFFCGDSLRLRTFETFGADLEPDQDEEEWVRKGLLTIGFERPWITDHLGVKATFEIVD